MRSGFAGLGVMRHACPCSDAQCASGGRGLPRPHANKHPGALLAVRYVSVAHQPLRLEERACFSSLGKVVIHLSLVCQAERPTRCTVQWLADGRWRGRVREWLSCCGIIKGCQTSSQRQENP
jgi:hypothetical protein